MCRRRKKMLTLFWGVKNCDWVGPRPDPPPQERMGRSAVALKVEGGPLTRPPPPTVPTFYFPHNNS